MKNRYKFLFVFHFLLYFSLAVNAQEDSWKNRLYIESNFHYGFVLPHHDFIAYFIQDHVKGYQINVGLHTTGQKKWQSDYNFPNIGIGFYHSGLGNNDVFGHINGLYGYVERFFFNTNRRFNVGNTICFGMAYITKRYDINNNHFDMAIGSHLNVFINYNVEGNYRLTPFLNLKIGAGFTHTSNGNITAPNKGLNLFTTFGGIQYTLDHRPVVKINGVQEETEENKNKFLVSAALGWKRPDILLKQTFNPFAVSAEYSRQIVPTGWLGASLNTYYDPSLTEKLKLGGDTTSRTNNIRISLNLSYEMRMGNLSYIIQPGIYLKNNYPVNGVISNRIGLRYYWNERFFSGVTIKAHWFAVADFIEFGVGYQWLR